MGAIPEQRSIKQRQKPSVNKVDCSKAKFKSNVGQVIRFIFLFFVFFLYKVAFALIDKRPIPPKSNPNMNYGMCYKIRARRTCCPPSGKSDGVIHEEQRIHTD